VSRPIAEILRAPIAAKYRGAADAPAIYRIQLPAPRAGRYKTWKVSPTAGSSGGATAAHAARCGRGRWTF